MLNNESMDARLASKEEKEHIGRMMPSYLGVFGGEGTYPDLDAYWSDSRRRPYLLWQDNRIVGFAFVQAVEPQLFELVEFYIAQNEQSKGYGRAAAAAVFSLHAGRWRVGVRTDNKRGSIFWSRFLASCPDVRVGQNAEPPALIYEFTAHSEA